MKFTLAKKILKQSKINLPIQDAAGGSLRQKDPKETSKIHLNTLLMDLELYDLLIFSKQSEFLKKLKSGICYQSIIKNC